MMNYYPIMFNKVNFVKTLAVPEELVPKACELAAEIEDAYYRKNDAIVIDDDDEIYLASKEYSSKIKSLWDLIDSGSKIIEY